MIGIFVDAAGVELVAVAEKTGLENHVVEGLETASVGSAVIFLDNLQIVDKVEIDVGGNVHFYSAHECRRIIFVDI